MSSTSAPFGLRPSYHPSGQIRPDRSTIATGYATTIHQYSAVKIVAAGGIELAAAADRIVGTFMGVEWTDSDGKRRVSNKWTASTAGTDIVAWITTDPAIIYEIQSDAALTQAMIGEQFDINTQTGNDTTGLSTTTLDVGSTAANNGLRLLDIAPGADNAWGDTYVVGRVQISEHQYVADRAAI